jgi:hypothetical protein
VGHLVYAGQSSRISVEDRTLMHLKIVIVDALRHRKSFPFSWTTPAAEGSGRSTIWIHPSTRLQFHFTTNSRSPVNAAWLRELAQTVDTPAGLSLVAEPLPDDAHHADGPPTSQE